MEKIAFLFPGQGSQYVGMGKTFYDQYACARQTFEEANDTLGFDLAKLCFEGSLVELSKTENTQPALLVTSIVAYRVYMQEIGIPPQFLAGHSLGEYAALTAAGTMKFADAVRIIRQRGELSQKVVDAGNGAMTIIDGIDSMIVEEECRKISSQNETVIVSCYNAPTQTAISGTQTAVRQVEDIVLDLGGQITPLMDSAPFHCILMQPAAEKLKQLLAKQQFSSFKWPVISNTYARLYPSPEKIVEILPQQMMKPVKWSKTMNYLKKFGVTITIEMGPQNILSNLARLNTESIDAVCFGQKEDRQALTQFFASSGEMKKDVPTVITRCLAIGVATPNANWNNEEYQKGIIEPYRRIQQIQDELDGTGALPTTGQMSEALELLRLIFTTKKLPLAEQTEWFDRIFDETGTYYLFPDFSIPDESKKVV